MHTVLVIFSDNQCHFLLNADSSIHLFSCLSVNDASNPMMKVKKKSELGQGVYLYSL